MSNNLDTGLFVNYVLSLLLKKITVPSGYHDQVQAVKEMLMDDVSGLIDSLTDFSVNSALVDFSIETKSEQFTDILKKWLDKINLDYNQIPTGIKPLAKEYFKERWKFSSFPILKIGGWEAIDGFILPTKLFFVDGESVYAKDLNEEDEDLKLINYDYYLGSNMSLDNKLGDNTIITRPYGRWYDKYPTPYLIKRGIYHNYKIITSLKNKETEILDQIIPYMLLVKKGTEGLARDNIKTYSNEELKGVIEQFQSLMEEMKNTTSTDKSVKAPIRATNFDEEIQHLIPDLSTIFDGKLFAVAERNILSGLGFIDVVEATSTSRRESILNPKAFIDEVKTGVEDFKQIIKELIFKIVEKNQSHIKYVNKDFYISSSPVKTFMTDDFKEKIRQLYDRGIISKQTAVELVAETDFETEIYRREKEDARGLSEILYPPVRENREGEGVDLPSDFELPKDTDEEEIPEDKTNPVEKKNYDIGAKCSKCGHEFDYLSLPESGMGYVRCPKCGNNVTQKDLITAPYTLKKYPEQIKKLPIGARRIWIKTFNTVYNETKDEDQARKSAWRNVKLKYKKKGKKWVRKKNLTKSQIEEIIGTIEELEK